MNLYEITNGWTGESYVRVYAWARDEAHAIELAQASFKRAAEKSLRLEESRWDVSRFHVEKLFSADDAPFVTKPSDAGFTMWKD